MYKYIITFKSEFQDFAANYWHSLGLPKDKLIIGLATYGRTFTLSSSQTGVGAPARGPGSSGRYTSEAGFLSYYEVIVSVMINIIL